MKRSRMRRVSAKRQAVHKDRVRPGNGIPSTCELCEHLDELCYRDPFELRLLSDLDPHHVYSRRLDDRCNVVTACRWCHDWCHKHPAEGRLIATWVLASKGRFDRDKIREAWGKDPIAIIEYHDSEGLFSYDPFLEDFALDLLERF